MYSTWPYDASELWLATDHTSAAKKRIAFDAIGGTPLFSGERLTERASTPVRLTRGQKYYIEVYHKQGTGSSRIQVGWTKPDGTQQIIPTQHLWQHPVDAYVGRLEPDLQPIFNEFGLNGGDLPESVSLKEGETLSLELDVIAAQPATVEWRQNGTLIAGEPLSYLVKTRVSARENGNLINATVRNAFGTLTTSSVRLDVSPDTEAPVVAKVDHRGDPNELRIEFSEPVTVVGELINSFEVKSGANTLATVSASFLNDKTVLLKGNYGFVQGGNYQVTVRNLKDLADAPNTIAPSTVSFDFSGTEVGPVRIASTSELNQTVTENRLARFEVALAGAKPWFYQWAHNGTNIPGATNAILEVSANDNWKGNFHAAVSNIFSTATSPQFQLQVVGDTNAPALVGLRGLAGPLSRVILTFDEPLDSLSGTNISNYYINGLFILSAQLSSNGTEVILSTSEQTAGEVYFVSVRGVNDRASVPNASNAKGSFISENDYSGEILKDRPVRYWRFEETNGVQVSSLASGVDSLIDSVGTLVNSPSLGKELLAPAIEGTAIRLNAASSQRITVPNGSDLNANVGPWPKKTVEFWFRAENLPAPDTTGLAATAGIWEQGAATRSFAVYLCRDPANPDPNSAELVAHAFNSVSEGAGSPFGLTGAPAIFAQATIQRGQTYHVAAVFDGSNTSTSGNLILYLNGEEVSRQGGIGQLYNHTGDVQIGRGNGVIHTGQNGDFGFFDGLLDEVAVYNLALPAERVRQHYLIGSGENSNQVDGLVLDEVFSRGNPKEVFATFSLPINEATGTNLTNVQLQSGSSPVQLSSVTLLPGNLTLKLVAGSELQGGQTYTVRVSNIQAADGTLALEPNPSQQSFTFTNGAVGIGAESQLASRTVLENDLVVLKVVPTGSGPFTYKWFLNGAEVPNEFSSELRFPATTQNSGSYVVRVSNEFSEAQSVPATISLEKDTEAPALIKIEALGGSINQVRLFFDEPLETATATNPTTFAIVGLNILSSSLDASAREVTLLTSAQTAKQSYEIQVRGLHDVSAARNTLNTTSTFLSQLSYTAEVLVDSPVRYWRFEETNSTAALSLASGLDKTNFNGVYVNRPTQGVAGLVGSDPESKAVLFTAASSNRVTVPIGSDLNAVAGPWSQKTIQFWFKARSVPTPGTTGLAASAGLWEQGAATRNISVYLWRDPANQDPNQAYLVFNALNNANDGAGAPFGPPATPAVFAKAPITANTTYHVVAVFDGDRTGLNGKLSLYLNGQLAEEVGGVGQIYNHTGDVQIGRGNGLIHTGENGDFGFFDGVIDEVSVYNRALSASRVEQLYQIGTAQPAEVPSQVRASLQGNQIVVEWDGPGQLVGASTASGPFQPIVNAVSPHKEQITGSTQKFFQVIR